MIDHQALTGLHFGLVALSGAVPDLLALQHAQQRLEQLGACVKTSQSLQKRYERFAGTDAERLAALYEFTEDDEVQLIMAARGGYGLARLLARIDFARLAHSKKIFVGHSDFNTLQFALLAQTGMPSLVGPMACYDFGVPVEASLDAFMLQHFRQAIDGVVQITWATTSAYPVDCSGILWGGNLSVLASLVGTPYLPNISQGILFLEDINEHPYRIERMLLQLQQSGILEQQKAILLGDFSGYRLFEQDAGYNLERAFAALQDKLAVPCLMDFPFGHCVRKASLRMGMAAHLNGAAGNYRLTQS